MMMMFQQGPSWRAGGGFQRRYVLGTYIRTSVRSTSDYGSEGDEQSLQLYASRLCTPSMARLVVYSFFPGTRRLFVG